MTDWELILACRRGDSAAWEQLVDRYERLVYSIPLNWGLSRDDAADVAQHCFIALMDALDAFTPDVRLGGWLATVARRQTWRAHEAGKRTVSAERDDALPPALLADTSDGDARKAREQVEWLHGGLANLDERCRGLLLALYFDADQPAYAEVAARLGMPVGSIGPTRARCLARLRELLGD
jgi:RNA polymerase sigma factor (sigma-70 family)